MIKTFDDGSYLQIEQSITNHDCFLVSICGRDSSNKDQILLHSVEIKKTELLELIPKEEPV
jgi:hypothetical protein